MVPQDRNQCTCMRKIQKFGLLFACLHVSFCLHSRLYIYSYCFWMSTSRQAFYHLTGQFHYWLQLIIEISLEAWLTLFEVFWSTHFVQLNQGPTLAPNPSFTQSLTSRKIIWNFCNIKHARATTNSHRSHKTTVGHITCFLRSTRLHEFHPENIFWVLS